MKKNLFLALGIVAACGLIACGNHEDPKQDPKDDASSESKKDDGQSESKEDDVTPACEKLAMADGSSELVCGTCDAVSDVKDECLNIGYVGSKEVSAHMICTKNGDKKVWVATITNCEGYEVCKKDTGKCAASEEQCEVLSESCVDGKIITKYKNDCSSDDVFDCANYGSCENGKTNCKWLDGVCDDATEKNVSQSCEGDTLRHHHNDPACSNSVVDGQQIVEETLYTDESCLTLKEGEDTFVGTCAKNENNESVCTKKGCGTPVVEYACLNDNSESAAAGAKVIKKITIDCGVASSEEVVKCANGCNAKAEDGTYSCKE